MDGVWGRVDPISWKKGSLTHVLEHVVSHQPSNELNPQSLSFMRKKSVYNCTALTCHPPFTLHLHIIYCISLCAPPPHKGCTSERDIWQWPAPGRYSCYSAQRLDVLAAHPGLPTIPPVSSCVSEIFCVVFVSIKFRKLGSSDTKVLTQHFKSSY